MIFRTLVSHATEFINLFAAIAIRQTLAVMSNRYPYICFFKPHRVAGTAGRGDTVVVRKAFCTS